MSDESERAERERAEREQEELLTRLESIAQNYHRTGEEPPEFDGLSADQMYIVIERVLDLIDIELRAETTTRVAIRLLHRLRLENRGRFAELLTEVRRG